MGKFDDFDLDLQGKGTGVDAASPKSNVYTDIKTVCHCDDGDKGNTISACRSYCGGSC